MLPSAPDDIRDTLRGNGLRATPQRLAVHGVRRLLDAVAAEPRLTATGLQTVGVKGWDGLVLALVGGQR